MDRKTAREVYHTLDAGYPEASTHHRAGAPPFESLIATILSAQTTDKSVDEVIGPLFALYPTPETLAEARIEDVEQIIHRTGFFHMKARRIIEASAMLVRDYGGHVPDTMELLLRIPGVGRKTANIVLYHSFGKQEGVAVDTHVLRLSQLIGFSGNSDAAGVEQDLVALFPKEEWGKLTDLMISHGRKICIARRPKCPICPIKQLCRYNSDIF
ncbi:MAG: endonuclease III [Methanomicrobiales archaeon]|nr:endonuclease III [Methanomicrobiales archaeon]